LLPSVAREPELVDPELWQRFADLVNGKRPWPLLLHGGAGRGKTCASLALCDVAATAVFVTTNSLIRDMIDGNEVALFDRIRSKDVAIMDEFGSREKITEIEKRAIMEFGDARCQGAPTVYVSNLSPDELRKHYDSRIYSRIANGTWFELKGKDRRFS
jgi:DNA replication protein DnaC